MLLWVGHSARAIGEALERRVGVLAHSGGALRARRLAVEAPPLGRRVRPRRGEGCDA
jgi:hypothetical protein